MTEYRGEDEFGRPWVRLDPSGTQIIWTCPLCRRGHIGWTSTVPVSGWDNPRWRVTRGPNGITLEPSLGCAGMRDGSCPGHWWMRDGALIPA